MLLKKSHFQYLIMNKILLKLTLLFCSISCSHISSYQQINEFVDEKTNNEMNLENFEYIIAINEMGDCINCNNRFAKLMEKHIGNKNKLFIVSSRGQKIDVSLYFNENSDNIIFDSHNDFGKLKIITRSAIIKILDNTVDTIIEIETKNVNKINGLINF